jgi:tetratricopeptide (TPR) repeat protein
LGERIRTRRKELGLTQAQLGGADVSKAFISLVEKGRAKPSLDTLSVLAQRLQKPVGYFLERGTTLGAKALRVTVASAWVKIKQAEFTDAAETFEEALALIGGDEDRATQAECYLGLATALAGLRQHDLARRNATRGGALAESVGAAHHLVRLHQVVGVIAYQERRLLEARGHFTEAYRRFEEVDHPDRGLGGILLYNIGNTHMELGDHVEAARWYRRAMAALESAEDMHRLGLVHVQLGVAERERGNYDAALEHLNRAEHVFEVLEDRRLLGWAHNSIGITLLADGKVDDAIEHIERSLRIKAETGDDPGRARSLTELGRAMIAKGKLGAADALLEEAERLTDRFGDVTEGARILRARGQLRDASGRTAEAIRCYKRAIDAFEALGMKGDLANCCNLLGDLLLEHGRASQAAPYLSRALEALRTESMRGPS